MNECLWKSHSADETMAFGRRLAQFLAPGDVLVLTGDLGAGKTQLTKGIAAGLGISDDVTSPTFTIEMVYRGGRLPLYHFDLYRLDEAAQLEDTGLFDVLDADGVCVIEWGERFVDDIGELRLDIYLNRLDAEAGEGEEPPRSIRLIPRCPRAIEIASGM
jgi:tRNA threonylcarbamoyladenosine biosynthesis protein TsaE